MNLKNLKNKIKTLRELSINNIIYHNYYHRKIDENLVYVESRDGKDFTGNILRIVEELSTGKYGNFKIFVYAREGAPSKIEELKKNYSLNITEVSSKEAIATQKLEMAKYIVSDSGMRPKYVKRPGQIFLNTWHGTPLKTMGVYNEAEEHRCANIQQVFFAADYLLYPNDYMKEKMLGGYMLEKIYPGKILLEGYPRNSVFFDFKKGIELKHKLGYGDKQLFAYMPTFKGILLNRKDDKQKDEIAEYLKEIDAKLTDKQILLVKLHVFNQQEIDFSGFKHVRPFPKGYEIYDVLNMTDCLVTDYSSVFFDYANTKRKIVIFNYDEEEYMRDRGTFFPISDLPFPKVQNVDDLVEELNSPKNYDDAEFIEKFCTYDNPDAVERICKHVFGGQNVCREEKIENDKKNILVFAGGLKNNGITSSLLGVLSKIDLKKNNIFICYRTWDKSIRTDHVNIFKRMPEDIEFAPLRTKIHPTILEHIKLKRFLNGSKSHMPKTVHRMFERELQRSYSGFKFDSIVQFNGYGINESLLFTVSDAKKSIWVHNDMVQEIELRANQNPAVLKYVYDEYDIVSIVSPDLFEPTTQISSKEDNIKLVHNINNYEKIRQRSTDEVEFNEDTVMITSNVGGINGVLESPGKKFITIGRFSPEKGHERLINAFNTFCKDYPDTQLIIIGGHGNQFNKIRRQLEKSEYGHNITLIKSIANPMPILEKCDLFVVSSFYEGWPMVIMEADTLNVPIIATSITGTQWMKDYGGHLYENSEEGILQGMYDFMEGKVDSTLKIDYEKYNENAVDEFLEVID